MIRNTPIPRLLLTMFASLVGVNVFGQGTFQNLNFEQASIPNGTQPTDTVPNSAMPGWNVSAGLVYDGFSLGGVWISICDSNLYSDFVVPQGKYCAYLFGGRDNTSNVPATISQTGLVPLGTESLRIDASWFNVQFLVTLGGQTINMIPLVTNANFTVYGGDISSFAGQVAELSFTAPAPPGPDPSGLLLDNIQFSMNPVPEPDTWALMLCGASLFGATRLKSAKCFAGSRFKA